MNKFIHKLLFFIFLSPTFVFAQVNLWSEIDKLPLAQEGFLNDYTTLDDYQNFQLNFDAIKHQLSTAPNRDEDIESSVFVTFPIGFNEYKNFRIYEVSTLSKELSEKFPEIKSYIGVSDNSLNKIRITLTYQGLFGFISTENGRFLINPFNNSKNTYQAFFRKDTQRIDGFLECSFEIEEIDGSFENVALADVNDSTLRSYRLAVAVTGEFSQYYINVTGNQGSSETVKKQAVMGAITTIIDRVNEIYERDVAVTFNLIANNDQLIYLNGSTDPFNNNNTGQLINQSQQTITNVIGTANYDVGHTFCTGPGGLAQLQSVCNNSGKARGVTGLPTPIGDPFAIDYVCHELGHQMGATHTFNSTSNGCVQQRTDQTAVEPGSGSTIMGYGGLCAGQNVQSLSDALFNAVSIDQMYTNARFQTASTCGQTSTIVNTPPVITPLSNYVIPKETAFEIEVTAVDVDGDQLYYTWDQIDNEITLVPPSEFSSDGALFRSRVPVKNNTRIFPRIQDVLNGNLTPQWEVIPSVARQINFAVTVRDYNALGGQSDRDDILINVVNQGPFEVTSQNTTGISYDQNNTVPVTWNVAGTDANGINATTVDIYLSYDGGLNFNTLLVSNVPNDGLQNVQIPIGTQSNSARIKIKASDNIFFAVNSQNFVITNTIGTETINNNLFSLYPNPNNGSFNLSFENAGSYNLEIYDLRGRLVQHQEVENNSLTKSIQLNNPSSGVYLVKVSNGSEKAVKKLIIQ
ncbi:reprolysin-like metallopeptidase [Mesonia sp. K7]|uniref:zinc-dependent metalloprotease n=1 Tax=Mesonia sp. K7 TaxID=2218606 RepID=UPI000DA97347|nr:zinc-dependent metalloprotease family protein [Mesonia sp. K7]PZD79360.1 hypothetical protein DNG35_02415 [Mesonia sp. K7]